MLQFTDINDQLLQKATEMKISMASPARDSEEIEPGTTPSKLINPHEVYLVTFKSLKDGDKPDIRKGGFRVMDTTGKDRKIFDFSSNSADADIQQVIHDVNYTLPYRRIMDGVIRRQRTESKKYILRILRQPELKIEAFWLHVQGHFEDDLFMPVITSTVLKPDEYYSEQSFFKTLEVAAKNRKTYNDDLIGG